MEMHGGFLPRSCRRSVPSTRQSPSRLHSAEDASLGRVGVGIRLSLCSRYRISLIPGLEYMSSCLCPFLSRNSMAEKSFLSILMFLSNSFLPQFVSSCDLLYVGETITSDLPGEVLKMLLGLNRLLPALPQALAVEMQHISLQSR